MRHIPEDELHAYLDQALSRPQCVEIESHLAFCPTCRGARDGIAALRDRTTALLAELAPPRRFPPPFDELLARHEMRSSVRQRRRRLAAWAASMIAAVGLGWTASQQFGAPAMRPSTAPDRPVAERPVTERPSAERPATERPATERPATERPATERPATERPATERPSTERPAPAIASAPRESAATRSAAGQPSRASLPASRPPQDTPPRRPVAPQARAAEYVTSLELSTLGRPGAGAGIELDGLWRTVSWAGAKAEAGDALPHVDGLPVVEVQVQTSREQGRRPLMMVAQQLASGEMIRTIEGPVSDVAQLLARRTPTAPQPGALIADSANAPRETTLASAPRGITATFPATMAMQRGDRMLAITGALPSDSLRAMIRRMNAELRTK